MHSVSLQIAEKRGMWSDAVDLSWLWNSFRKYNYLLHYVRLKPLTNLNISIPRF